LGAEIGAPLAGTVGGGSERSPLAERRADGVREGEPAASRAGDSTQWEPWATKRLPQAAGEPTVSRSGGPRGPPERDEGARAAAALPFAGARATPTHAPRGGGLSAPGCAWLRGRPGSRAQRGPRRSDQDGHDSGTGSGADGACDVPARILSERRPYGTFLCRGPSPAGLHSTARSTR